MQERYRGCRIKPYDKEWEVGDICIAEYHFDKMWYRGEVQKVLNKNSVMVNKKQIKILILMKVKYEKTMLFYYLKVKFVDYGNSEECSIGSLKKHVILQDIPIQCLRCTVLGLTPVIKYIFYNNYQIFSRFCLII